MFWDLLARFFEYLFIWLPRPIYIPQCDSAVVWTCKRGPKLKQGLWLYTPLFQDYERIDLRAQSTEFEPKILWTKDGKEAAVGMVVIWRVTDPLLCGRTLDSLGGFVSEVGESVLPELVGSLSLVDIKRKAAGGEGREWGFDAHLKRALSSLLEPYGISVDLARLNFTSDRVRTLKLIGGI